MPDTIRELYDAILKEGTDQGLSVPETMYSVGWIFHDLFERASHDERKGVNVTVASLDKYAADLPEQKIVRDIA